MLPAPDRLPLLLLFALFVGYGCSYFHRVDLAAVASLWATHAPDAELAAALPDIASLGMLVYAFGKFLGGLLATWWGGRKVFVLALAGAGVMELLAARCTTPAALAWCRVVGMASLALAWPSLGHVVAAVTPRHRLATVMAFVSQSYLLGDAATRAVLAAVVARGGDAAAVMNTAATGLLLAALGVAVVFVLLHRRQRSPSPRVVDAAAVAGAMAAESVCGPLLWLASAGCALAMVRESLSFWSPLVLVECGGFAADRALRASALLPVCSGVAALLAGSAADRGPRSLGCVLVLPSLLGAAGLGCLGLGLRGIEVLLVLALVSACTAMPNSLISGVLPLRAAGTSAALRLGMVDGASTIGAVLAGGGLSRVRAQWGPASLFGVLASVAALAALLAIGYLRTWPPSAATTSGPAAPRGR